MRQLTDIELETEIEVVAAELASMDSTTADWWHQQLAIAELHNRYRYGQLPFSESAFKKHNDG